MKKILILEDTNIEKEYFKSIIGECELVVCTNDISIIYNIESRKFKTEIDFEYIFIHKSFSQNNIPDEIISHLEQYVNDEFPFRLITFSGGDHKSTYPVNGAYTAFINRSSFKNNLRSFIDFSLLINQWYLPALYFENYKKRYLKANLSILENDKTFSIATNCKNILGYNNVVVTEENLTLIINKIKDYINE